MTKQAHRRITSLVDSQEISDFQNMTATQQRGYNGAIMFKDGTEYTEAELMSLR